MSAILVRASSSCAVELFVRKKCLRFSEGSSPSVFTPLLLFVKTQRKTTKFWLSEMEKTSCLTSHSSWELKELFQPELLCFHF